MALPILLLLALLTPFALSDLDLWIQRHFYDTETGGWPGRSRSLWAFLNLYGEFPGQFLLAGAGGLLLLGIGRPALHPPRKIACFVLLSLLVGPGLLVNSLFKQCWGRPRPQWSSEFGGQSAFERCLAFDPSSGGSSFPSGHASMGFFTMAVGLLLLAAGRRRLAYGVFLCSLVLGSIIGLARMVVGAHYASDIIFAALLVWCSTLLVFFAMGMHRSLLFKTSPALAPAHPGLRLARILSPVLVVALLIGWILQWPALATEETPIDSAPPRSELRSVAQTGESEALPVSTPASIVRPDSLAPPPAPSRQDPPARSSF